MKRLKWTGFVFSGALFIASCGNNTPDTSTKPLPSITGDSSQLARVDSLTSSYTQPDISPMDMTYFPVNYPKLKMAKAINTPPLARVIYSRPHLEGRHIFHEVLKYGEAWRLGANESTELDLYADATIQGKKIKAGRYVMYCIPQKDKWTIVLNSNIDTWGLQPDSTKDIAKFEVIPHAIGIKLEYFTMQFEKKNDGPALVMAWENTEAILPFRF